VPTDVELEASEHLHSTDLPPSIVERLLQNAAESAADKEQRLNHRKNYSKEYFHDEVNDKEQATQIKQATRAATPENGAHL
jgi:hypothetical protein